MYEYNCNYVIIFYTASNTKTNLCLKKVEIKRNQQRKPASKDAKMRCERIMKHIWGGENVKSSLSLTICDIMWYYVVH